VPAWARWTTCSLARSLRARHTTGNAEGVEAILEWLRAEQGGLLFANLVDFDTLYGHRNDVAGFERALREFDDALPTIRSALREDDLLFITADHGNDPTTSSTDHAREYVPLLALGEPVHPVPIGVRDTFSDLGATVAEWLNVGFRGRGTSFLPLLERGH
jgi:phosphopentomutase